jgi:hypothetical protein
MTTDAELIQDAISVSATAGIASASNDSGSVTKMSVSDQIMAANYLAAKNAGGKPHFGLRFTKCIPPGGG